MLDGKGKVSREKWSDLAVQYAEDYGWKILPIDKTVRDLDYAEDPVERQLNAPVLVEYPEGATSNPEEIRKLGTELPSARVGALTGEESNLVAVEIEGEAGSAPLEAHLEQLAGDTPRVVGAARTYFLFEYPDVEDPLPAITEKEGAVLHGQNSIIYLPLRHFQWGLKGESELKSAGEDLLSLFGLEEQLAEHSDSESKALSGPDYPKQEDLQNRENPQLHLPLGASSSDGQVSVRDSADLFRSGTDLLEDPKEEHLKLPWTVPGGLTVLTGRPKTSGKSTWVLNLAAHLAAGEPFLGEESGPSNVVLLSDTSPPNLKQLLQRVEILSEEDLAHLHVLHASDVQRRDWHSTLDTAYRHVANVGADLLIIDCLERYIQLKGGGAPSESTHVIHSLTAESSPECTTLAVTSADCNCQESLSLTIERLGLLGRSADAILRLDDLSTDRFPSLRRLSMVSRSACARASLFCALRRGRYVRVRRGDIAERSLGSQGSSPPPPEDEIGRLTVSD